MRGGPKHLAPALSLRDPCPHPRVPGDLFVLPPVRYLQAVFGLRIRSSERTRVDAAVHQVLERPLLPGVEEVGVDGRPRRVARVVGGERHRARSGWDGVLEVRLEPRYGDVGARWAPRKPAVARRDGVDHVRAVVVAVEQRPPSSLVYLETVGEEDAQ